MFKNFVFAVFIALLFMPGRLFASVSYAHVDLQVALESIEEGKNARDRLEKDFEEKQSLLQKKEEEIKTMTAEYQKRQMVMTPERRAEEEQKIQRKMMEYREMVQSAQVDMQRREVEITQPIINRLREVIAKIAQEEKYDLVYEINQSGIFYARDSKDITSKLIEEYNSSTKKRRRR